MKRLIVNADDLGYDRAVNDSIFRLIEAGSVTSATIMTNAPAAVDAAARLRDFPRASFGVHLNLTELPPLTRNEALAELCDESGALTPGWVKTRTPRRETLEAIFREWSAQVERAFELGVPVSHLDSHHHVHTVPRLFPILKRVQRRFGIRKVRLTRNIFNVGERPRFGLRPAKAAWNLALQTVVPTRTTDGFTAFATLYQRSLAGLQWNGTVEAMCHPGGTLSDDETRLLEGDWKAAIGRDAALISYHEL